MLNIKEVALKIADSLRNKIDGISHMQSNQGLVRFAEALISAYKAELLKEVGEPVAYYDPDLDCGSAGISFDPLSDGIGLYTSDQVAAAVARATNPLEEKLSWLDYTEKMNKALGVEIEELTAQLAAAQEEILIERSNGDHWRGAYSKWVNTDESARRLIELQEQLAKAEQRVAEACALQVATETKLHWLDSARVAKEIRSGEWRKFVKEV